MIYLKQYLTGCCVLYFSVRIVPLPKVNKEAALVESVPKTSEKSNEQAVVKEQTVSTEGEKKKKINTKKEKKPAKTKASSTGFYSQILKQNFIKLYLFKLLYRGYK